MITEHKLKDHIEVQEMLKDSPQKVKDYVKFLEQRLMLANIQISLKDKNHI